MFVVGVSIPFVSCWLSTVCCLLLTSPPSRFLFSFYQGVEMIYRPVAVGTTAFFFAVAIHWVFWLGVFIMILDTRARYRDYLYLMDKPFSTKLARSYGRSWCGRGVCEYVWPDRAPHFFYRNGYRWYHITPDDFPKCFFRVDFWKHVVGIRGTK